MKELSDDAKAECCALFMMGAKATVISHPPHKALGSRFPALAELVEAGVIERDEYNAHGSIRWRGTPAARAVAMAFLPEMERRLQTLDAQQGDN